MLRTITDASLTGLIAILAFVFLFGIPFLSAADIYRYTDIEGTVHLTDSLEKVPEKYRNSAKLTKTKEAIVSDSLFATPQEPSEEPETNIVHPTPQTGYRQGLLTRIKDMSGGLMTPLLLSLLGTVLTFVLVKTFIRNRLIRFYVGIMIVSCIYLVIFTTYLPYIHERGTEIAAKVKKTKEMTNELIETVNELKE